MFCFNVANMRLARCVVKRNNSTWYGAGLFAVNSSVTVADCLFSSNVSEESGGGGGLHFYVATGSSVERCFIEYNEGMGGGGMELHESDVSTENCVFFGNVAITYYGGGMHCWESSPRVVNCTFWDNTAAVYGGALSCFDGSNPVLTNCILWNNTAPVSPEIYADATSTPSVTYCDIGGSGGSGAGWDTAIGTDGGGNIDVEPMFVDAGNRDFHLKSDSPCKDTGDPTTTLAEDIEGSPRPAGLGYDMGAYEYQP